MKNRGYFPSNETAGKLRYLALCNIKKDGKMPPITWKMVANPFAILYGERFANALS